MKYAVIILARKGSKRIKNKNMREFAGKPLIEWTFMQAKELKDEGLIEDVLVNSDDENIIALAIKYKFKWMIRGAKLSGDKIASEKVIIECFMRAAILSYVEAFILLQPTSPLRTVEQIKNAIIIKEATFASSVISCDLEGKENGAIYICGTTIFQNSGRLRHPSTHNYIMSENNIDIDTEEDFKKAEKEKICQIQKN